MILFKQLQKLNFGQFSLVISAQELDVCILMDVALPVARGNETQPNRPVGGIGGQWKTPKSARIGSSLVFKVKKSRRFFQWFLCGPLLFRYSKGKTGGLQYTLGKLNVTIEKTTMNEDVSLSYKTVVFHCHGS